MIDRSPEIVPLAVDLHKDLTQMPHPFRVCSQLMYPLSSGLRGKNRREQIHPKSHGSLADIDATLVQRIFDIPQ